jgi:hypothetical protein
MPATHLLYLEDDFQFDRTAEWKAGYAVHQSARILVLSKNILQKLRSGISDFRLIADISGRGYRDAKPDDPRDLVERSEMLAHYGEDV